MKSAPCKDCPDREPGCHGQCNDYQAFAKERSDIRKKKTKANEVYYMDKDLKTKCASIRRKRIYGK